MFFRNPARKSWRYVLASTFATALMSGFALSGASTALWAAPKAAPQKVAAQPTSQTTINRADVKVELKAFRVERENGVEKLVLADQAKPGDIIEYQVRFRNQGSAPAKDLKPLLPIPATLIYLGNSARPVQVWASVDAKDFAPAPLKRSIRMADGKTKVVAIPLSEYRGLRWNAGTLAPGQSVLVKARARVAG